MSQIAKLGFLTDRLLIEPCLGVGARCVSLVAARLAMKISSAGRNGLVIVIVLAAKALVPSPSLDQRAIHREVFVRHQPRRLLFHMGKELLRQILIQQPVAVLAEYCVVPYLVVDFHT